MAAFREGKVVEVLTGDARLSGCASPWAHKRSVASLSHRWSASCTWETASWSTPRASSSSSGPAATGSCCGTSTGGDVEPGAGPHRETPLHALADGGPGRRGTGERAPSPALRDVDSIDGLPVVACGLHSQVAGVAAGIKAAEPGARVGYLMSDGGSLPLVVE